MDFQEINEKEALKIGRSILGDSTAYCPVCEDMPMRGRRSPTLGGGGSVTASCPNCEVSVTASFDELRVPQVDWTQSQISEMVMEHRRGGHVVCPCDKANVHIIESKELGQGSQRSIQMHCFVCNQVVNS